MSALDLEVASELQDLDLSQANEDLESEESALIQACRKGDIESATRLLEEQPNLLEKPANAKDKRTPLMIAAGHKDSRKALSLVELLLKYKADIDAVVPESSAWRGSTAFLEACRGGNTEVVACFLKKDSSLANKFSRKYKGEGLTPLMVAAGQEDSRKALSLVELLLNHNANLQAVVPEDSFCRGATAFFEACGQGNVEVVARFLEKDPSLANKPNGEFDRIGMPPLRFVANCQYYRKSFKKKDILLMMELLLDYKADIDAVYDGQSLVEYVVSSYRFIDDSSVFRLLLTRGVSLGNDLLIKQRDGGYGVCFNTIFNSIKMLFDIANKKECELSDKDQQHLKISLQELGLALNGRIKGETALQVAMRVGNKLAVEELLFAGAKVFISEKNAERARALFLPIVQAFLALKDLKNRVETMIQLCGALNEQEDKEHKERKESKEASERLGRTFESINHLSDTILNIAKGLSPMACNKLCYELGKHLEKMLPYIVENSAENSELIERIRKAFSQVLDVGEEELYKKACSKLVHYEILSKGRSMGRELDVSGLEEDSSSDVVTLLVGSELDPSLLGRALVSRIFPPGAQPSMWGVVRPGDPYELNVNRVLDVLQKEVSRLHEEIARLRKGKPEVSSLVSCSSAAQESERKQDHEKASAPQGSSSSSLVVVPSAVVAPELPKSKDKEAMLGSLFPLASREKSGSGDPKPVIFVGPGSQHKKRKQRSRSRGHDEFSNKRERQQSPDR